MSGQILVAGVGNIFFGDDGFGVEVAQRLRRRALPADVVVADFGIRGLHFAYELLEAHEAVIIADALPRGEPPGTVYVFEPDLRGDEAPVSGGAHGMRLPAVFATARSLGAELRHISIVGCEPKEVGEQPGLSAPVERAVEPAIALIQRLIENGAAPDGRRMRPGR